MSFIKEFIAAVIAGGGTGAAGKTPVKGTDYWTASDKAEIVQDTLAEIQAGGGGGTVKTVNGVAPDEDGNVSVKQIQANWAENSDTSLSYIKNRTHWGYMNDLGTFHAGITDVVKCHKDAFSIHYDEFSGPPTYNYLSLIYYTSDSNRKYFNVNFPTGTLGVGNASLASGSGGYWADDGNPNTMPFYIVYNRTEREDLGPEAPPIDVFTTYYDVYVQCSQGVGGVDLSVFSYDPRRLRELPLPYIPKEIARKSDVYDIINEVIQENSGTTETVTQEEEIESLDRAYKQGVNSL